MNGSAFNLPLPIDPSLAKALLVLTFVLHIVFVNLTLGGSLMAWFSFRWAQRDEAGLRFHRELLSSLTYMKSLAVVLGVGPLLLLGVVHADALYTSSVLIAPYWLGILALLLVAFVALYTHTYAWERLWPHHRSWLATLLGVAVLCFLAVPWVYLTNLALMLDPQALAQHMGFWEAMWRVGNVPARFTHFLLASLAINGVWVAWRWGRVPGLQPVRQWGLDWALKASLAQFVVGTWVWWSLSAHQWDPTLLTGLGVGVLFATLAMAAMWRAKQGGPIWPVALLLTVTVFSMAFVRHQHRELSLAPSASAQATPTSAHGAQGKP